MKLDTKIVILLLIATITVTFSGCVEEKEVAPEPEPLHNNSTLETQKIGWLRLFFGFPKLSFT